MGLSSSSNQWLGRIPKPQEDTSPSSRNWLQIDWSFPFRLDYPAVPCFSLQKPAGQYWLLSRIFWPFVYLWEVIVWIQDKAAEDTLKAHEAYEYGRSQTKYCSHSATQTFNLSHPFSFQGKFLKSCCLATCQGGDICKILNWFWLSV